MNDQNEDAKPLGPVRTIEIPVRGRRRIRHSRRTSRKQLSDDELLLYRKARVDAEEAVGALFEDEAKALKQEIERSQSAHRAASARANEAIHAHDNVLTRLRETQSLNEQHAAEARQLRREVQQANERLIETQKKLTAAVNRLEWFEAQEEASSGARLANVGIPRQLAPTIMEVLREAIDASYVKGYEEGALDGLNSVELSEDQQEHDSLVDEIVWGLTHGHVVRPEHEEKLVGKIEDSDKYQSLFGGMREEDQ